MRTINDVRVLVILSLALGACSSSSRTADVPAAATEGDEAPPKQPLPQAIQLPQTMQPQTPRFSQGDAAEPDKPSPLSAGQMLDIVAYIDAGDIAQGHVAVDRATAARVRNYALELISDNDEALQQVERLAVERTIFNLMPSDTSKELESSSAELVERLNAVDNSEFDRIYIKAQVDEHQRGLDLLRQKLLPACDPSSPVHAKLLDAETRIAAHLEKGRAILASLSPKP